jgi:hypothetical protein
MIRTVCGCNSTVFFPFFLFFFELPFCLFEYLFFVFNLCVVCVYASVHCASMVHDRALRNTAHLNCVLHMWHGYYAVTADAFITFYNQHIGLKDVPCKGSKASITDIDYVYVKT